MRTPAFHETFRFRFLLGFAICVALMAYAYYVQFDLGIEPCPLCIFQRLAVIAMGIFFLIGGLHAPRGGGRRAYALLVLLAAAAGAAIAAYHLWVQHLPPDPTAACTPGWNYWVENYSVRYAWSKTLASAFTGHADCGVVNWSFLGLAMPFWTLLSFIGLGAAALWAGFRQRN